MFRAPLCPSSVAHDGSVVYHIGCVIAFCPETHPSCLLLCFHPAATREPDDLCGNQRYRRERLMMGIMVPETC